MTIRTYKGCTIENVGISWYVKEIVMPGSNVPRHFSTLAAAKSAINARANLAHERRVALTQEAK